MGSKRVVKNSLARAEQNGAAKMKSGKSSQPSAPESTSKKKKTSKGTPLQRLPSSFYAVPLEMKMLLSGEAFVKYLFVKEKVLSIEEQLTATSLDRTLIVVNVSIDDTEATLRTLFAELILGGVSEEHKEQQINVELGKDRLALVRFINLEDELEPKLKSLTQEDCLARSRNILPNSSESCVGRWLQEYKSTRPDRISIGRAADERMAELEEREQQEREEANQPIIDEDGFQLVVSKRGRSVPAKKANGDANTTKPKIMEPKPKKGRLMDEKLSFYKFERRRQRNQEVSRLKDQFKNDRKRAMRLKQELNAEASS